jgi:hypothetical protein
MRSRPSRATPGSRRGRDSNPRTLRSHAPKEPLPAPQADVMVIGLGTRRRRTQVLYPLSYVPRDGGTRTRNLLIRDEGTPVCAAGRSRCQGARQPQRHRWLRGHGSNADLLVQCQAWYQFHHLASVWTGGLEPPTPGSRSRCAPVAPRPGGTDGRIRTDTDGGLSAVPLPVGLRQRVLVCVDQAGVEPAAVSLQGSRRFRSQLAHGSRERESNPRTRRMRPR